ncbi:MAG TPA: FkbM family methyltransferase [Caulobacteraceae bacterium]|nr:FkbM family methyltransferase [Caulobacteraceae bacterium]
MARFALPPLQTLFAPAIFRRGDETSLVREFFGSKRGVFVEVGANDPVVGSQTFHLEQCGWSGILVEPLAECVDRLRRTRSATVYAVAAGAPADEGKQLPLLVAGGLSTLGERIKEGVAPKERRLVPIRTLNSMLTEAQIEKIDFLSIDVEGAEIAVLEGLDLRKFAPDLILLEDDVHDLVKHRQMVAHGYRLFRRTHLNNWYVPNGTKIQISLYGKWQIFRKLILGAPLRRWRYKLSRKSKGGILDA